MTKRTACALPIMGQYDYSTVLSATTPAPSSRSILVLTVGQLAYQPYGQVVIGKPTALGSSTRRQNLWRRAKRSFCAPKGHLNSVRHRGSPVYLRRMASKCCYSTLAFASINAKAAVNMSAELQYEQRRLFSWRASYTNSAAGVYIHRY